MPYNGAFQRDSVSLEAELLIGTEAGEDLNDRINKAEESVLVVSPYLSEDLVNCLLELQKQGVVVDLVTMDDHVRKPKTATKLVKQTPSRAEAAVTHRRRGMLWSALVGIAAVSTAIALNGLFAWAPLGWFLLPVAAIVFL